MTSLPWLHSRLDLACERPAIRLARLHADDTFRTWGLSKDIAYDARTIVTELTTNAVRHVGDRVKSLAPDGAQPKVAVCTLCLWAGNGRLGISMYDESPEPPVLRPVSTTSENGRGLHMVAGLSEGAWGYRTTNVRPGKLVWASLRLSSRAVRAEADSPAGHLARQSAQELGLHICASPFVPVATT